MTRIFKIIFIYFGVGSFTASGQTIPALSFDLKKPTKFEDRKLGSEKTAEKKYTIPRRIIQNTVTKFNWHFNANEKLKQLIINAKSNFKDDYTKLLPFYNYSTDQTVKDTLELDSIIYKSNAGILLHDLRNGWIDNLYLIMGKAYFYSQEYDTAYLIFQYINYAFSPKEKDGYDKVIGSNANEGGNAFSISTSEKRDLIKLLFSHRPSRNESFLWLIRTNLARGEFAEAGGMIETLKNDPVYPQRLHTTLDELQAFSYYQQENYDSAVVYLERALPNAENRLELARWEFLLGQLYERIHKSTEAQAFFQKAAQHSTDPILEVYARLNAIRQNITDEAIDENIRDLVRMAHRDKYLSYRDIIYYAAAQMELERKGTEAAKKLLLLSTKSSSDQSIEKMQKSKSFLMLGDLSYHDGEYTAAKSYYDSVSNPEVVAEPEAFNKRKEILGKIVSNEKIIFKQDSLQKIAALPDAEREALIKKMVRKIKKEQGLKEEETSLSSMSGNQQPLNPTSAPPVSFDNNSKGDWYFYNTSLKTRGYTEFRSKWGNRPNVDNWRRAAAVTQTLQVNTAKQEAAQEDTTAVTVPRSNKIYESLIKALPLTPVQLKISNDSILNAKMEIAIALTDGLEDYPAAIKALDSLRERFPKSEREPDALLYLVYCYERSGNKAKAAYYKKLLDQEYADSESSKKLAQRASQSKKAPSNIDMTRRYEKIYRLFIEGQFEQALAEKREADAKYQQNYWTPQLLYIQSVYWIKERKDDSAIAVLNDIIKLYAASPLANKAKTMIDVLKRRSEIENYLNNLKVERPREEVVQTIPDEPAVPVTAPAPVAVPLPQQQTDTLAQAAQPIAPAPAPVINEPTSKAVKDTVATLPAPEKTVAADTVSKEKPAPEKVEPQKAAPEKPLADVQKPKEEPVAPPIQQPIAPKEEKPNVVNKDTIAQNRPLTKEPLPPPVKPSAPLPEKPTAKTPMAYEPDTESPHSVIVILDKVDGIFVNEAKNAFNLYNRQAYYGKSFTLSHEVMNETTKLVRIQPFANANEAMAYMEKARKVAETDIIPWLPAEKYRFIITSDKNLETLRTKKDLLEYTNFLRTAFPGKF